MCSVQVVTSQQVVGSVQGYFKTQAPIEINCHAVSKLLRTASVGGYVFPVCAAFRDLLLEQVSPNGSSVDP